MSADKGPYSNGEVETVYGPDDTYYVACRVCGRTIFAGEKARIWETPEGEYLGAECPGHSVEPASKGSYQPEGEK